MTCINRPTSPYRSVTGERVTPDTRPTGLHRHDAPLRAWDDSRQCSIAAVYG